MAYSRDHVQRLVGLFLCLVLVEAGCAAPPKKKEVVKPLQEEIASPPELSEAAKAEMTLETLYQEGAQAVAQKEYEKAIDRFIEILALRDSYRDVHQKLVQTYLAKKAEKRGKAEKKEPPSPLQEYTVNHGDILDISVWQWPDLKEPDVFVRPDGKISFPLIGEVVAVGRTLEQIDHELTERLTEFIKSPEVSISIRRFGGRKVIVLGEVQNPGVYAPTGRSSLLEVIALARGFNSSAVTSSVVVIRGDIVKSEAILCDLRRALKEGDLSQNITAEPNDIIYIPRRFISSVSDLARELGTQLGTVLTGVAVARDFNVHHAGN